MIPAAAAYLRPRTISDWDDMTLRRRLAELADAGADGVVVKPGDLDRVAGPGRDFGLAVVASFPCYLAGGPTAPRDPIVDLHGAVPGAVEWYTGTIPTDEDFNAELVDRCDTVCGTGQADGIVFDFLRWPSHWEHDLRPGARPVPVSFDRTTLNSFRRWAGAAAGPDLSDRLAAQDEESWRIWTDFRCAVISEVAGRLSDRARCRGLWSGVFIVPGTDEQRRRLVGQDVAQLGGLVDVLLPMAYHAILHRTPEWVASVVDEIRSVTTTDVVPLIQVTSAAEYAGGWDWGPPIPPAEVGEVMAALLSLGSMDPGHQGGRAWAFPGEAVTGEIASRWGGRGREKST